MRPHIKAVFRYLGVVIAFGAVVNLLVLASPLYMLQLYDRVLVSHSVDTLISLTAITTVLLFCMAALDILRVRLLTHVGAHLHQTIAPRLFDLILRRTSTHPLEPTREALKDLNDIRQFIGGQGLIGMVDAPWAVVFMVIIFIISPLLGTIALCGALVLVVVALVAELFTRQDIKDGRVAMMRSESDLAGYLRSAGTIRAMGMAGPLRQAWWAHQAQARRHQDMVSDRLGSLTALSKTLRLLMQMAMLAGGAWLVLRQEITPGVMIAGSIMMARALAPVEQAVAGWRSFVAARRGYGRLDALFTAEPEGPTATTLPAPESRLAVRGLLAGPPGCGLPVLKGLTFGVGPGTVLGIIGPSAAGKSTLAQVLVGIWPALAGEVRLDGINVSGLEAAGLGGCVGYLPQEVELFSGTIGENIARFSGAPSKDIVAAAQLAGIHHMILGLPDGYDTLVGGRGLVLSGGQRQRIGVARALFGDVRLVVLDEPDAHLDDAGRHDLYRALRHLRDKGCLVIVTTHRPTLAKACDSLLLLREGQIDLFGPAPEVLQRMRARGAERGPFPTPHDTLSDNGEQKAAVQ